MSQSMSHSLNRPETKIKICGITNAEDALAAIDAGADYLGLIFVEKSPRHVADEAALKIIEEVAGRAKIVGVFRNHNLDYVLGKAEKLPLDYVQLHGQEDVEYAKQLKAKIIKVLEIRGLIEHEDFHPEELRVCDLWTGVAEYILIDRPKGTNDPVCFDAIRRIAEHVPLPLPLFFAGALDAKNVGYVVKHVQPFAVDIASGVECSPGRKDVNKMNEFCKAVREGDARCEH